MADVNKLAEELVNLTIKEANELAKVLSRLIYLQQKGEVPFEQEDANYSKYGSPIFWAN
jgi:hypothetical protein